MNDATVVHTAPITALGLIGGYLTARETGIRAAGGVVLGVCGLFAGRTWLAKTDPVTTAALAGVYLAGFGAAHPLAKKVGPWPAVLSVSAASAGASYLLSDAR